MKKKAFLLTSIGALFLVGVSAVAISGIGQLNKLNTPVKASPTVYSVTFDAESTLKTVKNDYAIYTTTPRGAKVGVVGRDNATARFIFNGVSFRFIFLYDYNSLLSGAGAYQFSTITGFAISFSGGSVVFNGGSTYIDDVVSGHEYTGLSTIPDYFPQFSTSGSVTVTSLTIWYSC